jgi:hypothetical protein
VVPASKPLTSLLSSYWPVVSLRILTLARTGRPCNCAVSVTWSTPAAWQKAENCDWPMRSASGFWLAILKRAKILRPACSPSITCIVNWAIWPVPFLVGLTSESVATTE